MKMTANLQRIKRELVETLSPEQKEHFDSVRWLYNQQRASGKTYLLCVEALLQVCESGRGFVIDHFPYPYGYNHYLKSMLLSLANKFGLRIRVKDLRPGAVQIDYDPAPEIFEYK